MVCPGGEGASGRTVFVKYPSYEWAVSSKAPIQTHLKVF